MSPHAINFQDLLSLNIFHFLLVFIRLTSSFLILPFFSTQQIPMKVKVLFSFFVCLIVTPAVSEYLPKEPSGVPVLVVLILREFLIGLFFGTITLVMTSIADTTGQFISRNIQLANSMVQDSISMQQSSIVSTMLNQLIYLIFIVSGLFEVFIKVMIESYTIFRINDVLLVGDMANYLVKEVNMTFILGAQYSMPFIILSLIIQIISGIIAKLTPPLQMFFVTMPLNIGIGILLLYTTLPVMVQQILTKLSEMFMEFLP